MPTIEAQADEASVRVVLGSGYTCDAQAKVIYKGNGTKPVKIKKAKQALSDKIAALGNSKKDKAKKAVLKASRAQLKLCTDGTLSTAAPTPTPTPNDGPKKPGNDDFCRAHPTHPRCR